MSVVVHETDLGTKKAAKRALGRLFSDPNDWRRIFDEFWLKVELDAHVFVPKDTGSLDTTIRVVDAGEVEEHRQAPTFGASSIMAGRREVFSDNRAIIAGDPSVINPKSGQPVTYAQAVHDGHFTRGGSWVPARPFLTEAIGNNLAWLDAELFRYIDNEIKKGKGS